MSKIQEASTTNNNTCQRRTRSTRPGDPGRWGTATTSSTPDTQTPLEVISPAARNLPHPRYLHSFMCCCRRAHKILRRDSILRAPLMLRHSPRILVPSILEHRCPLHSESLHILTILPRLNRWCYRTIFPVLYLKSLWGQYSASNDRWVVS